MQSAAAPQALALGRLIGAGKLDPRTLVRETLAAAGAAGHGMIVHSVAERALGEAEAAYSRAQSGTRRSALDGVPIAWKDNIDVAGAPCEAGSRLLEGRRPDADAPIVARAARAGLVSFAKTGMTELAFSGLGLNPWSGTAHNAFDPKTPRLPGGSSAGAGTAIGSGLCALAVGTDTGGSVRIPAAWNGAVGLKTTAGLIPLDGIVALSPSYDTVGPLARSVADAAALFEILAGTSAIDLGAGAAPSLLAVEGAVLDGLAPEVRSAYAAALELLARGGITCQRRALASLEETLRTPSPVGAEAYALWGARVEAAPGKVYDRIAERILAAKDIAAHAAAAQRFKLAELARPFLGEMAGFDGVLMPTVAIPPPPIADVANDADAYRRANAAALSLPSLANRLGLCAITLPAGMTAGDPPLPFGLSLLAPPFAERRLLQIAAALERALN